MVYGTLLRGSWPGVVGKTSRVACLAVSLLMAGASSDARAVTASGAVRVAADTPAAARYSQIPISFEPNLGQASAGLHYISRNAGYTLALDDRGASLLLHEAGAAKDLPTLRLNLHGANPKPGVRGEALQEGISNYFIGNDPSQYRTNVPNYGAVRYEQVWPGIDWLVYGNPTQLEYDFVVAPGADPAAIHIDVHGAEQLSLDADGNLLMQLHGRSLRQQKPVIYQTDEQGQRQPVEGRYRLDARRQQLAFALGDYDHSRALVIDPIVLAYATYHGGSGDDSIRGIAVDAAGNAYVAGETFSGDLPLTTNPPSTPLQGSAASSRSAFVAKFNPAGTARLYATYLGGRTGDSAYAIAIDGAGNAYVAGSTNSSNFPLATVPPSTPIQASYGGSGDGFVVKLNATGSARLYATYLGGTKTDLATGIAVDSAGNAYVTGYTKSIDFPLTTADPVSTPLQGASAGGEDGFVVKINASGTARSYATYYGGSGNDEPNAIAVDGAGSAYVVGITGSSNLPLATVPPSTPLQGSNAGNVEGFVLKFAPSGAALSYATYMGGLYADYLHSVAVDGAGNAYITGETRSSDFPLATVPPSVPLQGAWLGPYDAFVVKLNAAGNARSYATFLGGSGSDFGRAIAVDGAGNAYVAGDTNSADFPLDTVPPSVPLQRGNAVSGEAFFVKLNPTGSARLSATWLGGSNFDENVYGIAVDSSGNAWIAGQTRSNDFPVTAGAAQGSFGGGYDGFIARIDDRATTPPPPPPPPPLPKIAIDAFALYEGQSGLSTARPQVRLLTASTSTVTVQVATSDLTATADSDYIARTDTLSFAPGETLKTFDVSVIGDTVAENDEQFVVTLSNPVGATIANGPEGIGYAGVVILNDDAAAGQSAMAINDVRIKEGNSGTHDAKFTISLTPASTVRVAAEFQTFDGTAKAGSDYEFVDTIIHFEPGETTTTVSVPIIDDLDIEPDETIRGAIFDATAGAVISKGQGTITIVNDDSPLPALSINDVTVTEGADGPITVAAFKVSLSATASVPITVTVSTADGSALAVTPSYKGDYFARTAQLTFQPGKKTQTFNVSVLGDKQAEGSETFSVNLSNASGATIARGQGIGTILDND